jgi:hypothetical protein
MLLERLFQLAGSQWLGVLTPGNLNNPWLLKLYCGKSSEHFLEELTLGVVELPSPHLALTLL